MSSNPWIERFNGLDRSSLKQRMICIPRPLQTRVENLGDTEIGQLKSKIGEIFLPTNKVLDIAEYVIGLSKAHSAQFYPSKRAFVEGIYAEDAPTPDEYPAVNLTGLAGVGKTAMLKALIRCMNTRAEVRIPNHASIEIRTCWVSRMDERLSPTSLLRNYLALDGEPDESNIRKGTQLRARRRAYRRGIAFVATDETQFKTYSTDATALITKTLMCLVQTGIPNLYASNYSLGHRLSRRGQEDRDRLQSDPRILLPDTPDEEDWLWTLIEFQKLAPRLYQFDSQKLSEQLHYWTAGLKRKLGRLLVLSAEAARKSKRPVTEDLIEKAYKSTAYSMSREEVIILHKQAKTNQQGERRRPDLWCPYELPESVRDQQAAAARAVEQKKIVQGYMKSAMSPDERARHEELKRARKASGGKKATVTPIRSDKTKAQILKDADREFLDDR
jgi:hypothetical protein